MRTFSLTLATLLLCAACGAGDANRIVSKKPSQQQPGWQPSTVLLEGYHPSAVALDSEHVYAVVAPFTKSAAEGVSGIAAIGRETATARQRQLARYLLRCTPELLPNHMAGVHLGGGALYWLNGLTVMKTAVSTGETRAISPSGSLTTAFWGKTLYTFNHNNERKLLAIDTVTGTATELAVLDLAIFGLAADAHAVYLMTARPAGLWRFDLASKKPELLHAAASPRGQISWMVPFASPPDSTAGRFTGLYFVERDPASNVSRLMRLLLSGGTVTDMKVASVDGESPAAYGDSSLFYFSLEKKNPFDPAWALNRLSLDSPAPERIASGTTGPRSVVAGGGAVFWSDLRAIYSRVISGGAGGS